MAKPSPEFVAFVLDQLAHIPALSSAPFFGGVGIKSGGVFFAMIMGGTLYFATSARTRPEYEKLGSRRFTFVKGGRLQETKFFEVPADALEHPERIASFAQGAIESALERKGGRRKGS